MESVLIIDDHQATRETFAVLLRNGGFATTTASTGREGIDRAVAERFDVILLDFYLPDISGADVVRQLKVKGVDAPVVVITAFPSLDNSFDVGTSGAAGFVEGPLFGDEVLQVVNQARRRLLPVRHPARCAAESDHRTWAAPLDSRVRDVMHMIDSNISSAPSVGELAARVGLGESALRHLFHASTGLTITKYRTERRLQEAARRLTTTHDGIRQIAHGIGYGVSVLREFRRAFHARFGMSPKAYRRRFWRGHGWP